MTCQLTSSLLIQVVKMCVLWSSKLQLVGALSTTEADYIAISEAARKVIIIAGNFNHALESFDNRSALERPLPLLTDSTTAVAYSKVPLTSLKVKHLEIR